MSSKPSLTAHISHELCVGSGMCIALAPDAFRYNGEGLAIFIGPGARTEEQLLEAADACPMAAIIIAKTAS